MDQDSAALSLVLPVSGAVMNMQIPQLTVLATEISTTFIPPSLEMHQDCLSLTCSGMRVLPLYALYWASYLCMRQEINHGHTEGKNKLKLLKLHLLLCIFTAALDPAGR